MSMILSSSDAASTDSGIHAIRSYQDSVYMEVTSQATERTSDVRTAMVIGSSCRSTPAGSPGTAVQGTTLDSIQAITTRPAYAMTPTTTLAQNESMNRSRKRKT